MKYSDDDDTAENAELTRLYSQADDAIAAGFDVLPAWVWRKDDGTFDKTPALRDGYLGAHRDRQVIRQQLIDPYRPIVNRTTGERVPQHAVRVLGFMAGSGGCGVLDCDVKHGAVGDQTKRALMDAHGWKIGASWRSASGGENVLFTKPDGATFSNHSPWPGIDVCADHRFCVAPGTEADGARWEWIVGGYLTAAPLPAGMLAQLRAGTTDAARRVTDADLLRYIEESPTRTTSTVGEPAPV